MSTSHGISHLVPAPTSDDLHIWFESGTPINPGFPNWDRSFVSGSQSPLFAQIEHRDFAAHPGITACRVSFTDRAEGPPGHVHGGATAGLLDEVLGIGVWNAQHRCVTESLALQYLKTIPLDATIYVVTQIKKAEQKTVVVECTVYDQKKIPHVCAQGIFHRLTPAQLQKFDELTKKFSK